MIAPIRTLSLLLLLFFLASCASSKLQYDKSVEDWAGQQAPAQLAIKHTVFLIGDAVKADPASNEVLQLLGKHLAKADENSSVIFLGNNVLPEGIPSKSQSKTLRKIATAKIDQQLALLDQFEGKPYFIAGNEDWKGDDVRSVRRLEKYIEKKLNADIEDEDDWEDYFFAGNACGGPQIVEVNDQLLFLFVDSNWYLKDWDRAHPSLNEDCAALSRPVFRFLFEELARKYKNKNVIIASYHQLERPPCSP